MFAGLGKRPADSDYCVFMRLSQHALRGWLCEGGFAKRVAKRVAKPRQTALHASVAVVNRMHRLDGAIATTLATRNATAAVAAAEDKALTLAPHATL